MYHWQGTCVKKGGILGVYFTYMVYNSCMVKYIKIYRAYGTFDSWALALTNRYIWESTFTYLWYVLEISSLCIKLSSEHFTT